jgi:hypothetical protein
MIYLVDPKIVVNWCPLLCQEYLPAPLYGIPACWIYD